MLQWQRKSGKRGRRTSFERDVAVAVEAKGHLKEEQEEMVETMVNCSYVDNATLPDKRPDLSMYQQDASQRIGEVFTGSRQRELFPLPFLPEVGSTLSGASHSVKRRLAKHRNTTSAVNEVIGCLNELSSGWEQRGPPTLAQCLAQDEIRRQVLFSPTKQTMYTRRGAASELLASSLSYVNEEAFCPVKPYARSL
eukprot:839117-Karenia_brevis.AAC.1